jgi:hypothetical protein
MITAFEVNKTRTAAIYSNPNFTNNLISIFSVITEQAYKRSKLIYNI